MLFDKTDEVTLSFLKGGVTSARSFEKMGVAIDFCCAYVEFPGSEFTLFDSSQQRLAYGGEQGQVCLTPEGRVRLIAEEKAWVDEVYKTSSPEDQGFDPRSFDDRIVLALTLNDGTRVEGTSDFNFPLARMIRVVIKDKGEQWVFIKDVSKFAVTTPDDYPSHLCLGLEVLGFEKHE